MTPEEIIKLIEQLMGKRANWETYWQDLAHFCLPRRAYINRKRVQGEKLDFHRLYDGKAIRSLRVMAAGFHSHLTNPSSKWFSLATQNKGLMEDKEVKMWFKDVEDEMFSTLNTSNFDSIMQEFYSTAGCFGTSIIFEGEDFKTKLRFASIPIEEVFIEEDAFGRVTRLFRVFEYTVQQAFDRWGDKGGAAVAEAVSDKRFQKMLTFIHAVFPREKRIAGKEDSKNMPWASIWLEKSKKEQLSEGGFMEFPYAVGRFYKEANDPWGFSPAMDALPDIKMLNAEKKTIIRGAMKVVDPPFTVPNKGFILPMNFNPAAANYRNPQTKADDYAPLITKANIGIGLDMIQDVKNDVEEAFFVPLFRAFSMITKQMTIPEVERRIAENMVLLGPVVGRFTQEVFDPLIIRAFMILFRLGAFPPPPPQIAGQELDIKYISQLARAQRASEVASLERTFLMTRSIAEIDPSVVDKFNSDKAIDITAEINGTNPEVIRDDDEVAEIREARVEAETVQAKLVAAQQGADIAKTAAESQKAERQ